MVTDLQVPSVSAADVMEGGFRVVDVRSPAEFADGHVPGAVNMPLLDDAERALVGTAYKEEGSRRARMAAMELVSSRLPLYLGSLDALARDESRGRRLAVMCWRGGERSRNVVLFLALVGVHAVAVKGGYRAYRREVVSALGSWRPTVPVITLYGPTGAGKSALLRAMADLPRESRGPRAWPLDLEFLALHRGSLLGGLNQPAERRQKDFDALLWEVLRRPRGDYLVVECEGGRVGNIFLPGSMTDAIRGGLPVLVNAPVGERVARIVKEYAPETWDQADVRRFRDGLKRIGTRLPPGAGAVLETAFDDGRFADVVEELLVRYYDPLYSKSCVEGRDFLFEFDSGLDAMEDARRFVSEAARLI